MAVKNNLMKKQNPYQTPNSFKLEAPNIEPPLRLNKQKVLQAFVIAPLVPVALAIIVLMGTIIIISKSGGSFFGIIYFSSLFGFTAVLIAYGITIIICLPVYWFLRYFELVNLPILIIVTAYLGLILHLLNLAPFLELNDAVSISVWAVISASMTSSYFLLLTRVCIVLNKG